MTDNPYRAPTSTLRDRFSAKGLDVKAALVGVAIYIAGTTVAVIGLFAGHVLITVDGELSLQAIGDALDAIPEGTSWIDMGGIVAERLVLVLAGWMATDMSGHRGYSVGAIIAAVAVLMFAVGEYLAPGLYTLAENVLLAVSAVGATLLGSRLAFAKAPPD